MTPKSLSMLVDRMVAALLLAGTVTTAYGDGLGIPWWTSDAGGATFSTGSGFRLGGTIAQPDAGSTPMTGGGFRLTGGFWVKAGPAATGACCLPNDICQILSQSACVDGAGGFYQGDNVPCEPNPCVGLGQIVLDGAARDALYDPNTPLAVQELPTSYGDANLGRPDWANGSELDAAYGVVRDGTLYLVLAGNFQTNGNRLEIFFDTRPGGQNRLLGSENPDVDYGALQRMGYLDEFTPPGLKFAPGFEADYYLTLDVYGDPTIVYASYAELYRDPGNPGVAYYLGEGRTKCETSGGALTGGWPGAPAIRCTLDNSNVLGVTGSIGPSTGAGVLTGYELAIPLSAIGNPTSDFTITAFINSPGHDWVSNQVLGEILTFSPTDLGDPRAVDFEALWQFPFVVPVARTPVGACCVGTTCSIQTQADCTRAGGVYGGDNVSCDGNPCDQTPAGRCCIDDGFSGECRVTTAAECAGLGGTYTAGETCAGCPCLLGPPGACCVGGNCGELREEDCAAQFGVFAGPFSSCAWVSCTQGACCVIHDCSVVFNFECWAAGGRYVGDGSTCGEHTCNPTISTPTVAGTMNGWDTTINPMTETSPGSQIWQATLLGQFPGSREEFKITDGTWNHSLPAANSWGYTGANAAITITYDGNTYADGWAPAWDRIGVSVDPGTWTAVGDWQGWDPANPATAMVPHGGGIYVYQGSGLAAGPHYWKAVVTGSWDSISWNERSVNTADMGFTIAAPTDVFGLWVDALAGRVKVTAASVLRADLNCDGSVNFKDINPFVQLLTSSSAWQATYPGCPLANGDINSDGSVNFKDINPFVACLTTGHCP